MLSCQYSVEIAPTAEIIKDTGRLDSVPASFPAESDPYFPSETSPRGEQDLIPSNNVSPKSTLDFSADTVRFSVCGDERLASSESSLAIGYSRKAFINHSCHGMCYRKILRISYKDHFTNEEVCAKIQHAIGPHEDLLTIVMRRRLKLYGIVSPSPRGQWRTDRNGGKWLWSHVWCPNDPRG